MTIDESDDDAVVIQSPIVTAKRKMKGACIVWNSVILIETPTSVPPPGGENPGKRPKPASYRFSGSENPDSPVTTSQTQTILPFKTAGSSEELVLLLLQLSNVILTCPFCSLHLWTTSGNHTKTQRSKSTGKTKNFFTHV